MASITIKGVDELSRKLTVAQRNDALELPMRRAVYRLQNDMAKYPAEPPNSKYRRGIDPRSERLGQRWTTKVSRRSDGVEGKVGNNASYAAWVQSDRFQAWMHKGRWQTDKQVVERNERAIVQDFERAIAKALK